MKLSFVLACSLCFLSLLGLLSPISANADQLSENTIKAADTAAAIQAKSTEAALNADRTDANLQFNGGLQHNQFDSSGIKFGKTISKKISKQNHFIVPVYFATDRRNASNDPQTFDFKEQVIENVEHVSYGVFTDRFALHDYKAPKEPKLLSCAYSVKSNSIEPSSDKLCADSKLEFEALSKALKVAGANEKGVLVHVHGCCMGFNYAAHEAAMTAAWLNTPVVLYDWGSPFGAYAGSLQACERSQERFNKFMTALKNEIPANKITLLGFSLGNQLIVDHCLQNKEPVAYKDIIMVRPDVDLVAFKSHLPKLSQAGEQLHLYLAKNDVALHLSGSLRKMANLWAPSQRLGVSQPTFFEYPNLTVLDVSKVDPLHSIPNAVMADIARNDGLIPVASDSFDYSRSKNGILEVTKH